MAAAVARFGRHLVTGRLLTGAQQARVGSDGNRGNLAIDFARFELRHVLSIRKNVSFETV
jgi:hypothetical protein